MFKRIGILSILLILLMLAFPAMAQEVTPEALTPTVILPPDSTAVPNVVIQTAMLFAGGLLVVLGGSIMALYRSTPPFIQDIIKLLVGYGVGVGDKYVAGTVGQIDDAIWNERIRAYLEKEGFVRGLTVADADKAIYGAGIGRTGDWLPGGDTNPKAGE